jgi:hypothetical protein
LSTFCGANVIVEIEDVPVLECAGVSYSIQESKRPIYGYSSRHFDAVASGQVIVQGSLLVNYVDQNYLFEVIRQGALNHGTFLGVPSSDELSDQVLNPIEAERMGADAIDNYGTSGEIINALKSTIWDSDIQGASIAHSDIPNPHDAFGGVDIKVTFGERHQGNNFLGISNVLLSSVYFTGRGNAIQIDENVVVEEYPFFARNIYHLK